MKKIAVMFLVIIITLPIFSVFGMQENYGDKAYQHICKFSNIGNRAFLSESEKKAREYILDNLKKIGYRPKKHKFKVEGFEAFNIEANKKGIDSSKTILIGAHYDGRSEGNSFDDNGSGISVLLELCEIFKSKTLPYDVKFVFFAGEEINVVGRGLHGSYNYTESLSKKDKDKIVYMINLDTLVSGDKMYVYNSYKESCNLGKIEEHLITKIKEISNSLNLELCLNCKEDLKISFTNTKSDYYPFYELGIPVLYFESTNWDLENADGRTQSRNLGRTIHNSMDNMVFIESIFEDRVKDRLTAYVNLILNLVSQEIKLDSSI